MLTNKRREELTDKDRELADIGFKYWPAELSDITDAYECRPHVIRYAKRVVRYMRSGIGLLLVGPNGHGKTHIAVAVQKEAIRHAGRTLFLEAECLTSARIEKTPFYAINGWTILDRARVVDLLVLDDLGSEHVSEFDKRAVEGLIRFRGNRGKATIITTNLTPAELKQQYGRSLQSVLSEKVLPLIVKGKDWRAQIAADLKQEFYGDA